MKKKVLITGGHGGIASAIISCLEADAFVYAPGRKDLDVTDQHAIQKYFERNGPYDVVINNAGSIHPLSVVNSDPDKWINDINVNLIAPYLISKFAVEMNPKVVVINISSTAGYASYREWSSYCASKAGLITLTKSMANEGVQVYAISPGATDTKFRSYFDLNNDNLLSPSTIADLVVEILEGNYNSGDNLFVRNGCFEIR